VLVLVLVICFGVMFDRQFALVRFMAVALKIGTTVLQAPPWWGEPRIAPPLGGAILSWGGAGGAGEAGSHPLGGAVFSRPKI